jgi:hypothetical protein
MVVQYSELLQGVKFTKEYMISNGKCRVLRDFNLMKFVRSLQILLAPIKVRHLFHRYMDFVRLSWLNIINSY